MGELVSKVAVCAQKGKKADGLDGEACEEDVYTLRYLSQGVSERPFPWPVNESVPQWGCWRWRQTLCPPTERPA